MIHLLGNKTIPCTLCGARVKIKEAGQTEFTCPKCKTEFTYNPAIIEQVLKGEIKL